MIHKVCRADSTLAQRFRYRCRIHRTFPGTTYLPYPTFQPASPHHTPPTPKNTQHSATLPPPPAAQNKTPRSPCKFVTPMSIRRSKKEFFCYTHRKKTPVRPSVKTNSLTHSLVVKKKKQSKKKQRLLLSKGGGDAWMQKGGKGGGDIAFELIYIYASHQVNGWTGDI